MLTLTLDGQPVDLPADAEIALTLWAHDLRNSATREATFSETFTLPPSARNARALGAPHVLGTATDTPYRKLPAVLRAGGVVVLDGVAVLDQAAGQGYDVTLYAPTADLFALVKSRPLRALDLSAYDHPLTFESIAAAQPHASAQGYAYPLSDDGRLTGRPATEPVLYHEVGPFVFAAAILRQIVAECLPGYTLTGSLLAEATFQRLGFPRARPWPALRQSVRDGLAVSAARTADVSFTEPAGGDAGKLYPIIEFPDRVVQGDAAPYARLAYFEVPPGLPCDVRVKAQLLLTVTPGPNAERPPLSSGTPSGVFARLISDPNGFAGPAATQVGVETPVWVGVVLPGSPPLPTCPVRQQLTLEHTFTHLEAGTLVAVQFYLHWGMGVTVHAGSTVAFEVGERTYAGGPVHLEAGLPDISQADALQFLANAFQAVFQTDAPTRTVRADLFTDLERNRARAVDWTRKLDRTLAPATTFRLDGYAQRNRYVYAEAPAAYPDALLRPAEALLLPGVLPVADATLEAEATRYEAPVFAVQAAPGPVPVVDGAPSGIVSDGLAWLPAVTPANGGYGRYDHARVYALSDGPVAYAGRYWQWVYPPFGTQPGAGYTPRAGSLGGFEVWREVGEERLLSIVNDELAAVALLSDGFFGSSGIVYGEDAPSARQVTPTHGLTSAGLDWQADLLPAYYPTLAALLARARILGLSVTLSAADIAQLDYLRPIRLDVAHWPGVGPVRGLFYLNQVDQWQPGAAGGAVKCELIRLGDPVPGLAPDALPLPARPARLLFAESGQPLLGEPTDYLLEER
jgi:hypothetical protein